MTRYDGVWVCWTGIALTKRYRAGAVVMQATPSQEAIDYSSYHMSFVGTAPSEYSTRLAAVWHRVSVVGNCGVTTRSPQIHSWPDGCTSMPGRAWG